MNDFRISQKRVEESEDPENDEGTTAINSQHEDQVKELFHDSFLSSKQDLQHHEILPPNRYTVVTIAPQKSQVKRTSPLLFNGAIGFSNVFPISSPCI